MKTIGIKLADGSFYPVLEDNTASEKSLTLTTAHNNQTKVMVDLYRSPTCSMEDAEYVDSLQIENLNAHPNGVANISFTISLDENNQLSARIIDQETGNQSNTTISLVSRTLEERLVTDQYDISDKEDKKIKGGSADDNDYKHSGYDRGHLVPARDMAFSKETLKESFLFSNISPQVPKFNRGKWAELEGYVREMAKKCGLIYVITGPIFDESDEKIGKNNVSVPSYFFKALLFYTSSEVEAIGFIMPNQKLDENLEYFACSIDMLELLIDIDVFASLPDDIEEVTEKNYSKEFWFQENNTIEIEENDE